MTRLQIPPTHPATDVSVGPASDTGGTTVIPLFRGDRPTGLFTVDGDDVQWHPVVEPRQQLARAVTTAGAVAGVVALTLASRRRQPVREITMGPGGWVSFKNCGGSARIRARDSRHRPWWAHLLRAHRVQGM